MRRVKKREDEMRRLGFVFLAVVAVSAVRASEFSRFDGPFPMPDGPFKGQALETEEKRSIHILSADQAKDIPSAPGDTVVANFYSEGKFWIARIPAGAVAN